MTFKEDKLEREKYSDFLTEIISYPSKYKRLSDSDSLTIAIDSSWGTGKTTFLEMWKNKLEATNEFSIISYNAWENDFANGPLESFMYTILNHNIFDEQDSSSIKKVAKTSLKIIKLVQNITNIKPFNNADFEALEKRIDNATSIQDLFKGDSEEDVLFGDYSEYKKLIEDLKESLHLVAQNKPIIIIIDELDRCKPLFSIKLLEIIKHIFDVPNVTFVFALDMEQLGHSIKCVYGSGMDANGYLCRFFDYISKMPKPNVAKYIKSLIDSKSIQRTYLYSNNERKEISFTDLFYEFSKIFNLSLRDINTIYNNFIIFESIELKKTSCVEAYSLYLLLLILKYKYIKIYNSLFDKNENDFHNEDVFKPFINNKNKYFNYISIIKIMEHDKIKKMHFQITFKNMQKMSCIIGEVNNEYGVYLEVGSEFPEVFQRTNNINISGVLFNDDLDKYEEIKEKTLSEYIQEKLEFFDFSLENKELSVEETLIAN